MHAIVHIGAPKAGSSAIQTALRLNAEEIEQQGFHQYTPAGGPPDRALSTRFRSDQKVLEPVMQMRFNSVAAANAWSARCWAEFEEQVRARHPRLTLLSSEHFFLVPEPKRLIDALRQLFSEITVVAYVRDPVDHYGSKMNQLIRGGVRFCNLETPLDFRYHEISRLGKYADILGADRMVVRNFDRANLAGGDVVTDFIQVVGRIAGRPLSLSERPPRTNESLCAAAAVWLLAQNETFQRVGMPRQALRQRFELIRRLQHAEALRALPKLKLDVPEFADLIRHNARATCAYYNDTFLAGQLPMELGTPPRQLPEEAEVRARMRDWLFGHLTPEALDRVLREVVPLRAEQPDRA